MIFSSLSPPQPLKPKLPKKIFKSTRLNLNRYWNKIEELIGVDDLDSPLNNQLDSSYRALIEPEFIPNNQPPVLDVRNIKPEDLTNFITKQFYIEKNLNRSNSGRYKYFSDESLYHGLNLNQNPALLPNAPVIYDNKMQAYCSCCHTNTIDGDVVCEPIYENLYPPANLQNINWTF